MRARRQADQALVASDGAASVSTLSGFDPSRFDGLDEGIAGAVAILLANGIETFESCEGGAGHAFPEPTVRFHGRHSGFRAFTVAMEHGLPVLALRLSYAEYDQTLDGPHWEIVFREKVPNA